MNIRLRNIESVYIVGDWPGAGYFFRALEVATFMSVRRDDAYYRWYDLYVPDMYQRGLTAYRVTRHVISHASLWVIN